MSGTLLVPCWSSAGMSTSSSRDERSSSTLSGRVEASGSQPSRKDGYEASARGQSITFSGESAKSWPLPRDGAREAAFVGVAAEIALTCWLFIRLGATLYRHGSTFSRTWLFFIPFALGDAFSGRVPQADRPARDPSGKPGEYSGRTSLDHAGVTQREGRAASNCSVSRIALASTAKANGKRSWGSMERRSTTIPTTLGRPFFVTRNTGPPLSPG